MDEQLQQLIERGVAAGMSDEDIALVVQEHQTRVQPMASHAPAPPPQPTTAQNIRNTLKFLADGLVAPILGNQFSSKNIEEHPLAAAASIAVPGVIGGAMKYGGPLVRAGALKTAKVLEDPIVSGGIGAAEGYRRGGFEGAVTGALTGGVTSRVAKKVVGMLDKPAPVPGAVIVKGPKLQTGAQVAQEALDELRQPAMPKLAGSHTPRGEDVRSAPALVHSMDVAKAQRPGAAVEPTALPDTPLDWRKVAPDPNSSANFVKGYADKSQTELAQMLAERDLGFAEKGAHIKQIKKPIYPEGNSQTDKLVAAIRQREHVMGGPQDTLTASQLTGSQLHQLLMDALKQRQLK